MKNILLVAAALTMIAAGAPSAATAKGAPPTAEQKAPFSAECLRNSGGNTTLCTCKAEQAMKLVDTDFMKIVLATMKGQTLPVEQSKPYAIYISNSNKVCAPGM
jgi:hypothetical protein